MSWFNDDNFDFSYIREEVREFNGGVYTICYSSATATRNLTPLGRSLNASQKYIDKYINKGDTFASTAIYYDDELICFKQTGAGSECDNIEDLTIGDVDLALTTLEEENIITETTKCSYEDLKEYEKNLNSQGKTKTKSF